VTSSQLTGLGNGDVWKRTNNPLFSAGPFCSRAMTAHNGKEWTIIEALIVSVAFRYYSPAIGMDWIW
jgi:hypothetical protein